MEKFYCDHCRLLYNDENICQVCGCRVTNKIWIEVQNQQSYKKTITIVEDNGFYQK